MKRLFTFHIGLISFLLTLSQSVPQDTIKILAEGSFSGNGILGISAGGYAGIKFNRLALTIGVFQPIKPRQHNLYPEIVARFPEMGYSSYLLYDVSSSGRRLSFTVFTAGELYTKRLYYYPNWNPATSLKFAGNEYFFFGQLGWGINLRINKWAYFWIRQGVGIGGNHFVKVAGTPFNINYNDINAYVEFSAGLRFYVVSREILRRK